jgi:hypothetical protein
MDSKPQPDPATVELSLALARAAFDDERDRGQGLEGKSSTLAGFSGAILAINLAQVRDVSRVDLDSLGKPMLEVLLVVSGLMLAAASLLYLAVLRPREYSVLDVTLSLLTAEAMSVAPEQVQGRMATTLGDMTIEQRAVNNKKARTMAFAGWALALGLVSVGAESLILGVAQV